MKTLYKDEVIAKLRKLPTFVWYIIFAASYFFREAWSLTANAKATTEAYLAQFAELGITGINGTGITVMVSIFSVIIAVVIYEIIFWLAHSILSRRFVLAINRNDFSFRLRLLMIISNIILGLVGITYFFTDKATAILTAIFDYSVPTLLLGWFYEDFRVRYVPKRNHAKLFAFVSKIYIGIYFVFSAFYLIFNLTFYTNLTVIEIVSLCVDTVIVVVTAVMAYFNYRRLVKIADGPEDNDLFISKEEDNKKDDNIFKDFGF